MLARYCRLNVACVTRQRGLTVVELLVTLLIVGTLFALALPTYRGVAATLRVSAAASDVVWALQLARAEAIKRRVRVAVCERRVDILCPPDNDWSHGWMVASDDNDDRTWSVADAILRQYNRDESKLRIVGSRRSPITFSSDGRSPGSTTTVTLCHPDALHARQIVLNNAGRIRTASIPRSTVSGCNDN